MSKPLGSSRAPLRRRPQARGVVARRRLLLEAERWFGVRGYEATSMKEIAEGAGVSVRTLCQHFPDKRALLVALIDDWADREIARKRDDGLARFPGADPRKAVLDTVRADAERVSEDCGVRSLSVDLLAAAYLIQTAINATAADVFVHDEIELRPEVMLEQLTDMICTYVLEEPE